MAVNDSIISLIEDVVDRLRNKGTIISESFLNGVLTLELTSLYDLAVNKYIEIDSIQYKIIAIDSGLSTVDVVAGATTGASTFTVPTPFFYNGTMQMINKKIVSNNDNFAKYPAICLVDVFQINRITDPTSTLFAEPRLFIAFLKESLIDYGSDLQNPIINEMQNLCEDFITALQQNKFIARFDDLTITRHANFGVFATDRGHISTIIDEQLSGVVLEITLPIYENFENCEGNILTANKCAPSLIKSADGTLLDTLQAGEVYTVLNDVVSEFVFNENSTDVIEDTSINSNLAGTYTSENLTNVSTVQYEIDTGSGYNLATLPFTLEAGNAFKVTITRSAAGESIVQLTGTY